MSIRVANVSKIFGEQKALDNVTFSIKTGEVAGFIGPNGAGKSTMMKILTGILPQSSGEAAINDVSVVQDSLKVRQRIGYLPENNPQYEDMYVKEYLNFLAGVYSIKDKKKRIDSIIEQTGLTAESRKKIVHLSKGYKQRVGLAQALLHDPDVLILDEPTSGLDPNQIIEIRNLISSVRTNKTIMLSTHIMQEVEAICDRIIVINKGKIVANDTTQNIKQLLGDTCQRLTVQFDKETVITNLKNHIKADMIEKNKSNQLEITAKKNIDVRTLIMEYATSNKLTILQLSQQEHSLEEIFQVLTNNKK